MARRLLHAATLILMTSFTGCALWPACWTSMDSRPCYCPGSANPCCTVPPPQWCAVNGGTK